MVTVCETQYNTSTLEVKFNSISAVSVVWDSWGLGVLCFVLLLSVYFKWKINFFARLIRNLSMGGFNLRQCRWSLVLCMGNHKFILNPFGLVLDYSNIVLAVIVSFYFYHSGWFTAIYICTNDSMSMFGLNMQRTRSYNITDRKKNFFFSWTSRCKKHSALKSIHLKIMVHTIYKN